MNLSTKSYHLFRPETSRFSKHNKINRFIKNKTFLFLCISITIFLGCNSKAFSQTICDNAPAGTIFCDDFETSDPLSDRYFENSNSNFLPTDGVGRNGSRGLRAVFGVGTVSAGSVKKSFGRTPSNYIGNHAVNPTVDYDEIYWRIDIRTQPGWQGGGGNKLSRATAFAAGNWSQGMIAHIWSDGPNGRLTMDPASGIDLNGNLVTTGYNDFPNLRWLGNKTGDFDLFSTENSGIWYCIEAHIKLNTPGENDGIFEFWIDGILQKGSYNLNWHATWNNDPQNYMINAIMLENYWNAGSPVAQERYMDNFIISTAPIGCDSSLSVNEEAFNNTISITPNPISNVFTINLKDETLEKVIIYNQLGQQVKDLPADKVGATTNEVNISNLSNGIYFVKITSQSGKTATKKVIKK